MKIYDRIYLSERKAGGGYSLGVLSDNWTHLPSAGALEYRLHDEDDEGEHDKNCNGGLNEQCDCTRIATKGELRFMLDRARRDVDILEERIAGVENCLPNPEPSLAAKEDIK